VYEYVHITIDKCITYTTHTHTHTLTCVYCICTHTMLYTQTSHPHTLTLTRAGAAGTAVTVWAVPLFGRLTISRCGLAIRKGGVAPTWWRSIDVDVVHACS